MLVTVDTGGTKTLVASFNQDGTLGTSIKFPTPHDQNEYLTTLRETLQEHFSFDTIDAIVVALPGRIDANQELVLARNLHWKNFNIQAELGKNFDCPILVENDANLAGLAAARQLPEPVRTCLYVTVSTGIGTGLIVNSHIDADYRQSEGGQMVLEHNGHLERWENFASGRAIHEVYGLYASEITDSATWKTIGENISRGFLALLPILRPDVVVIGGSIGTYFDKYSEFLINDLKEQLHYVPPIMAAIRPEEAVIYGCYYYALDTLATTQPA
jgi:glucokinase